ncbi:MAG: trypsin-like serine protease [Saonia sp.]
MKQKLFLLIAVFGLFFANAQQRIIGGNNTTVENNPWQISMRGTVNHHIPEIQNEHFCGGSILSPDWILIAAQCVTNFGTGAVIG